LSNYLGPWIKTTEHDLRGECEKGEDLESLSPADEQDLQKSDMRRELPLLNVENCSGDPLEG